MDARDVIKIGMSAERRLVVPPEQTVGHLRRRHADGVCNPDDDPGNGTDVGRRHQGAACTGLGHGRHRGRYPPSRRDPGGRDGANHGAGDRSGTPGDPVRGRSLRWHAPHRRGPPRPRPRQCRGVQQALRGEQFSELRVSPSSPRNGSKLLRVGYIGNAAYAASVEENYFANSLERRVAAATARVSSGCMPSFPISTSSAAAVVPPGEVTFWRSVAEASSERCNNSPEPATVSRARRVASAGGRPASTPARASSSASRKI